MDQVCDWAVVFVAFVASAQRFCGDWLSPEEASFL
jgi:hypothetical protein